MRAGRPLLWPKTYPSEYCDLTEQTLETAIDGFGPMASLQMNESLDPTNRLHHEFPRLVNGIMWSNVNGGGNRLRFRSATTSKSTAVRATELRVGFTRRDRSLRAAEVEGSRLIDTTSSLEAFRR